MLDLLTNSHTTGNLMPAAAKPIIINRLEAAYLMDVGPAQVSKWAKEDMPMIEHKTGRGGMKIDGKQLIRWYVERRIRNTVAGQAGQAGKTTAEILDFNEEKTRLTRAQADKTELEVRIKSGEVAPVGRLGEALDQIAQIVAASLDSIPAELQRVAPHLSASDIDVVRRVIARAQNGIADTAVDFSGLDTGT